MITAEQKSLCDFISDNCQSLSTASRIRVKYAVRELIGCELSDMGDWSDNCNKNENGDKK